MLYVPGHPEGELDADLKLAGIPKETKEGKVDFHELRATFVTLAAEAGANIKKLQTLARHSTPELTANIYARAIEDRLSELTEKMVENISLSQKYAHSVPK